MYVKKFHRIYIPARRHIKPPLMPRLQSSQRKTNAKRASKTLRANTLRAHYRPAIKVIALEHFFLKPNSFPNWIKLLVQNLSLLISKIFIIFKLCLNYLCEELLWYIPIIPNDIKIIFWTLLTNFWFEPIFPLPLRFREKYIKKKMKTLILDQIFNENEKTLAF